MKKFLAVLAVICVLCLSAAPFAVFADVYGGNIALSDAEGNIGDTVDITFTMSDNPGFISANLYVNYDMNVLKLTKVTDGGILNGPTHSDQYTSPYGLCWLDDLALADTHFNGKIVTLSFKILDTSVSQTKITVDQDIVNFDLDYVRFNINGGTVTVKNAKASDKKATEKADNNTAGTTQNGDKQISDGKKQPGTVIKQTIPDTTSAQDKIASASDGTAETNASGDGSNGGANPVVIIGIIVAAAVVCAGGGFLVYKRVKK